MSLYRVAVVGATGAAMGLVAVAGIVAVGLKAASTCAVSPERSTAL